MQAVPSVNVVVPSVNVVMPSVNVVIPSVNVVVSDSKICRKYHTERNQEDYYRHSLKYKKNACRFCLLASMNSLYDCSECHITLRETSRKDHEKSQRHLKCKFWNESYDYNKLQPQNKRRQEKP